MKYSTYKTSNGEKPLCISFNNVYEYINKNARKSYLKLTPRDKT